MSTKMTCLKWLRTPSLDICRRCWRAFLTSTAARGNDDTWKTWKTWTILCCEKIQWINPSTASIHQKKNMIETRWIFHSVIFWDFFFSMTFWGFLPFLCYTKTVKHAGYPQQKIHPRSRLARLPFGFGESLLRGYRKPAAARQSQPPAQCLGQSRNAQHADDVGDTLAKHAGCFFLVTYYIYLWLYVHIYIYICPSLSLSIYIYVYMQICKTVYQ